MAHKKVTIDLNGGDAVTANGDLLFQLLGSATEGGTYAILAECTYVKLGSENTAGSDAAVTIAITGDIAVLDHVDIGTAVWLKYQVKDEAGNESIASAAVASTLYHLNGTGLTDEVRVDLSSDFTLAVGDYIEIKYSIEDANQNPLITSDVDADNTWNAYINQLTNALVYVRNGLGTTVPSAADVTPTGGFHVLRYDYDGDADITLTFDGTPDNILGKTATQIPKVFSTLMARLTTVLVENSFLNGSIEYVDFNGDKLEFKHTGAVHVSNGGGVTVTVASGAGTTISTLFSAIP